MLAQSSGGSSYAGSVASSKSSSSRRAKADKEHDSGSGGEDLWDKHSTFENGIFGVLFTLSKENSETRIRIRWVLLKVFLDTWQLFTTVVSPDQGWHIDANGAAWTVVGVLNFTWLADLGYTAYVAVLYCMVALLAINVGMCVWVAWCFKEHKFPVVWPIKVLRVFSSVFFQAFDVASLNLLQLGFTCRFTGPTKPHLHFALFPEYSCAKAPHILHAIVSGLCLVLFVAIALLLNMAEVEVNLKSRRPLALGHSGAEVTAFAIKVLLTLVNVVFGWKRVAACFYLVLALALAYQYLRWNPNLVAWMNYLKAGGVVAIVWCTIIGVFLVFEPGVKDDGVDKFQLNMTITMLAGLAPAFGAGALMSWAILRHMTAVTLKALANAKPEMPLEEICDNLDEPRDVEIVARCCRVWKDRHTLEPDAVNKAHHVIKAGMAMFPSSAYMHLLHANFMIDVLGVAQSGSSRLEDARKLNPGLMSRFVMFVRQQQATQKDAGKNATDGASMDLLGYVEYQRKQRMVVRLHRDALQAMCNFWKALDAHTVSFTHLSKALAKIDTSVSEAQAAYRVVLESYSSNPKLVRLYGKFLQTIKNDPWGASEYFADAERLEEAKNGDNGGPLLPDGTPLGRMDEMDVAVLVLNSTGEIQMANRQTHTLFGYKRGNLEGKPMSSLLAPHFGRRLGDELSGLVSTSGMAAALDDEEGEITRNDVVLGMHCERLAFPVKLTLRRASGIGEDSTIIALMESVPPLKGVASLWVAPSGTIAACDPQFVANFGWKATEVNGATITALLSVRFPSDSEGAGPSTTRITQSASETMRKLLSTSKVGSQDGSNEHGLSCMVAHKYDNMPTPCTICVVESDIADTPVYELRIKLVASDPTELLAVNRKGVVLHATLQLAVNLKDAVGAAARGNLLGNHPHHHDAEGELVHHHHHATMGAFAPASDLLEGYTLHDFMPPPWKDMHVKYLKEITAMSAPGRGQWTCRKAGGPGTTMELRTSTGKTTYMQVAVTTSEIGGEMTHVVRVARSSLEAALDERRLRLSISEEGLIEGVSKGASSQLFGFDPNKVVGRGIWEILEDVASSDGGARLSTPGPRMITSLVNKAMSNPGCSWRVRVGPPAKGSSRTASELTAAARATLKKPAVLQVMVEVPAGDDEDAVPVVYVDLWPTTSVTGVVELDASGRMNAVLEEGTRPAGLLFGVPTQSLVGSMFSGLVTLPPGRSNPSDLLTLSGAKKSSLKTTKKEASVKVGPLHVLQAAHSDGRPLVLDVQMVGRPGPNQPVTAILRMHAAPMMPAGTAGAAAMPPPASVANPASTNVVTLNRTITRTTTGGLGADTGETRVRGIKLPPPSPVKQPPKLLLDADDGVDEADVDAKDEWDDLDVDIGRSISKTSAKVSTPVTKSSAIVTGYSNAKEASGAVAVIPAPMDSAGAADPAAKLADVAADAPAAEEDDVQDLQQDVPEVAPAPAAKGELPGRNKLADLVKSVEERGGQESAGELRKLRLAASGHHAKPRSPAPPHVALPGDPVLPGVPGGGATAALARHIDDMEELLKTGEKKGVPEPPAKVDVQSVADSETKSEGGGGLNLAGVQRVSAWVASKGAFYQNTVAAPVESDDEKRSEDIMDSVPISDPAPAKRGRPTSPRPLLGESKGPAVFGLRNAPEEPVGNYHDDDAASEGGQSAMSGQSGNGGAEYKRGKRYRKLVKLMDSSQAQQVQQKFRRHALATVALLGVTHVICFSLTITAIQSQRDRMLQLSRNGQAQRYIQEIMTDVRSLDVISRNKTLPNLYTPDQAAAFASRISTNAENVKTRFNDILDGHHTSNSEVLNLLYYTQRTVWGGNDLDGSDIWTNLTVWDFATRFFSMAKTVEQHYAEWLNQSVPIANTVPGQFILKSGPNLFGDSALILNALLRSALVNVEWIDTLQLVFLAVEGAAISFICGIYLAYLLRAVAAQRYKLYGTFLVIPVGLTRALASQNTNLVVDDDDDESSDEEEERPQPTVQEDQQDDDGGTKTKRHATLRIAQDVGIGGDTVYGARSKPTGRPSLGFGSTPTADAHMPSGADAKGAYDKSRVFSPTADSSFDLHGTRNGCWGRSVQWLRRMLSRRNRSVSPLPQSMAGIGNSLMSHHHKRNLRDDSHETATLLLPLSMWSVLVIAIYAVAVARMKGVMDVVAIHSVANFMSARTYRAVFFCQELAALEDASQLLARRDNITTAMKLVRDAWYTLQLGDEAYKANGPDTERFPMVKAGLSYASQELRDLFYSNGNCHRQDEDLPCPGPEYRYYQISHTGLDSIMQQFIVSTTNMATNKSMIPEGLADDDFDFVYNVAAKDLVGGTVQVEGAHYKTITRVFTSVMVLHIVLLLLLFLIFSAFLVFLLNPLLKRITKERRRIAELMSQLPLELDVEKLVARALDTANLTAAMTSVGPAGSMAPGQDPSVGPAGHSAISVGPGASVGAADAGTQDIHGGMDAVAKWKAIIRSASSLAGKQSMRRPSAAGMLPAPSR
ncbi:hypothetical protein Agub_g8004 [Astrephomene gubernaculifera]|uniref:PAS domain-containing protein n=1 Tax=Astrephomene gubernaculifera TaxID=47775 RepID=A0AAD3HN48_9CHLO|nr:hypothetical protein Agub_g8004 [Astrephomene gubernaculifera]